MMIREGGRFYSFSGRGVIQCEIVVGGGKKKCRSEKTFSSRVAETKAWRVSEEMGDVRPK